MLRWHITTWKRKLSLMSIVGHFWKILKNLEKMPTMTNMNMGNSSFPTPIDLDRDETPMNEAETTPSPSTRQVRPFRQKKNSKTS